MAEDGYIQVYTGNGKGKTTAALGLALRAAGRGMKTYVAQFLKKGAYGELAAAKLYLPGLVIIEQFGLPDFHHRENGVSREEREAAAAGMVAAKKAMASGIYRIVVLDEINTLLHFEIIPVEQVLQLLAEKPPGLELILTGRYAPEEILAHADLITDMQETRHYYQKKVLARNGIEK
ncbi:MAG: cob(I)yrinic acid a,c-diamide adenosyltransferase [Candidatus Aminicenantes bacterium]|nr:cob(I)yrinic acid a,c-diamide adenosyltransferase [Candidatus Aminicenantes bacterium]